MDVLTVDGKRSVEVEHNFPEIDFFDAPDSDGPCRIFEITAALELSLEAPLPLDGLREDGER